MSTPTQKNHFTGQPPGNRHTMVISNLSLRLNLPQLIQPETQLESTLLTNSELVSGLNWGKPRFGHPEGKVGLHIREVLDNIEQLNVAPDTRSKLRLLAITHDAFKFQEEKTVIAGQRIHHGILARRFMKQHVKDEDFLDVLELHDEAFYAWRQITLKDDYIGGQRRLEKLMNRLGDNLALYFLFFKCDTETGDKILAPLYWFEKVVDGILHQTKKEWLAESLA